ncbi:MAG: hypothetical protein ALAOOOJD_01641 [bacterium]|nr:hypothetical protein [bacterium]
MNAGQRLKRVSALSRSLHIVFLRKRFQLCRQLIWRISFRQQHVGVKQQADPVFAQAGIDRLERRHGGEKIKAQMRGRGQIGHHTGDFEMKRIAEREGFAERIFCAEIFLRCGLCNDNFLGTNERSLRISRQQRK